MAEAISQGWKEVSGECMEVRASRWKEKWVDTDSSTGLAICNDIREE